MPTKLYLYTFSGMTKYENFFEFTKLSLQQSYTSRFYEICSNYSAKFDFVIRISYIYQVCLGI